MAAADRARMVAVGLSHHEAPAHLRVAELVALGRYPYSGWLGRLRPADRRVIDEAMRSTGVEALAAREVATLSDGEAQKAHIARGIAQEAPLLVLDEPTAYLDVTSRVEITRLLAEIAHGEGRIVLFSTHDLSIARETADRMWLFLPEERRVAEGAPEDLVIEGTLGEAFSRRGVRFTAAGEADTPPAGAPGHAAPGAAGGPAHAEPAAAGAPEPGGGRAGFSQPWLGVRLLGPDGPRLYWTRRALRRAGFVEEAGPPTGSADARGAEGYLRARGRDARTVTVTVGTDRWHVAWPGEATPGRLGPAAPGASGHYDTAGGSSRRETAAAETAGSESTASSILELLSLLRNVG
jgi:ABC-type cobalamin/Fe3+-siderophores transport system ATPase subunit